MLDLAIDEDRIDVRDAAAVRGCVADAQPELVVHLAAQSLVRRSHDDPAGTWATNVMGTVNVLEACRAAESVRAIVVVTTDKCYANRDWAWGYRENDRLGGRDPYGASKASVELVAESYRQAYFGAAGTPLLATARAGNVIGGGDWGEDRLIPDLVRAQSGGVSLAVRSPASTRPWQHVLDCLSGYLVLAEKLLAGDRSMASAWNFGPDGGEATTVSALLGALQSHWPGLRWHEAPAAGPREARQLVLDSTRARTLLEWRPVWGFDKALAMTAAWYRRFLHDRSADSRAQLADYVSAARDCGLAWARP
jgi:CDP-glucose 4,6-dehydratase